MICTLKKILWLVGLVICGMVTANANAQVYTVVAKGNITQVLGNFDSSVQVGTPYTYTFTWDTSLPSNGIISTPNYDRQTWNGYGAVYGATVTFGNYSSTGDASSVSVLTKQHTTNPAYAEPDLVIQQTTGGSYTGNFSYSGQVYTQIERGAAYDAFTDTSQDPAADWTTTPIDPNFSGIFWRLNGGPTGDDVNSRFYGNLTSMSYTAVTTPEPNASVLLICLTMAGLCLRVKGFPRRSH